MSDITIRCFVLSPRNLEALMPSGEVFQRRLIFGPDNPDVLILDTRQYADLADLTEFRRSYVIPALFVVRNQKELSVIYSHLLPGDDICMLRDFRQTSTFRVVRLYGDGSGKTPMDFYKKMLTTDALTGLQNRRSFGETLEQWSVGVSSANPLSAIFLDLDHFKAINDFHGHAVGDRVLVEVANLLKPHISDEIKVSRYGGEEMLILMKADNSRACEFAEFLRKEIEANVITYSEDNKFSVTASFGVATVRDAENIKEKLIQKADEMLYRAKSEGRNRVEGLDPENDEDAGLMDEDAVLRDFEARLRVTTDRLVEYLSHRGRKLVGYYRNEADRDGMTGLHRKEYFMRRFAREFENAKKDGRPLTLLFLDIDDFGNVNRTYGYPTGDSTLKKVSGVMLDSIRSVDWTARYGGEELCIIMPGTPIGEALQVAERIRHKVESLTVSAYDGREFGVTVSIGLAEISDADGETVDLIQRAGDKTREAKRAGKNTVRY